MYMVVAFLVSCINVFMKALQQQNVIHLEYKWVLPTSIVMTSCEVTMIGLIAWNRTYWMIVPIGLGGGLGCLASMYLYNRMRAKH